MKTKTRVNGRIILYIVLILITAAALLIGILSYNKIRQRPSIVPPTPAPVATPTVRIVTQTEEKIVEIEKVITSEILQERLREIGFLASEEYYFTIVSDYSNTKKILNHEIPLTESSYVVSYDGVVTAGIDFTGVAALKDDKNRTITITMPEAVIQSIDIDPGSFKLYSEKNGLWNPISVSDFNDSLMDMEAEAERMAIERGILDRAAENAQTVIRNLVGSLIDTSACTIQFETMEQGEEHGTDS